jgi:hypothetical protein
MKKIKYLLTVALLACCISDASAIRLIIRCEDGTYFADDKYGGNCYFNGNCYKVIVTSSGGNPCNVSQNNPNDGTCQESGDYSVELNCTCGTCGLEVEVDNNGTMESIPIISLDQVLNTDGSRTFTFVPVE